MARVLGIALALGCAIVYVRVFGVPIYGPAVLGTIAPAAPASATEPPIVGEPVAAAAAKPTARSKSVRKTGKPRRPRSAEDESTAAHLSMPSDAQATPAYHYAQLSQADCEAELGSRRIDFIRETALGVQAPVRLTGPVRGVVFRSDASARRRTDSPYEIVDCRLVLALDDFAQILQNHDIVEVRHYSMWRPPKGAWPDGKIGKRHDGALAIDTGRFIDSTGAVLDVDKDFHGAIGARTCGEGAEPRPATTGALTLRAILCEAAERRLFNVMLTPNYNRPHKNHFHLELTAGVEWFLVH